MMRRRGLKRLAFPVALKLITVDVVHKTESGAVGAWFEERR
jgi:hypothetical protein